MSHVRPRSNLPLVLGLLLLPALGLPLAWLRAQNPPANTGPGDEIIRFSRNLPGDTKPIQLAADEVFAWTEGNDQAFLLKGQVFIQHGVFNLRAREAIVFVDLAGYRTRGIWRAEVYAEGNVSLDNSSENKETRRAAIDLNTRGEVKVHSGRAKLAQQNRGNDPLVQMGRSQRRPIEVVRPAVAVQPVAPLAPYVAPGASSGIGAGTPAYLPPGLPTTATPNQALPAPLPPLPASTGGVAPEPYVPPGVAPLAPTPVLPGPAPVAPPGPRGATAPAGSGGVTAPPGPLAAVAPAGPGGAVTPAGPGGAVAPAGPGGATDGPLRQMGFRETSTQPVPSPERAVFAPGAGELLPEPVVVTSRQPLLPPPEIGAAEVPQLPPPAQTGRPPVLPPLTLPDLPERRLAISPRSVTGFGLGREPLPSGEQALVVTGGVILNIRGAPKVGIVDLEADRLVIISKKTDPQDLFNGMREPEGQATGKQTLDVEFYLAGNVEIRQPGTKGETRTIRADEVFYDVKRSCAIAINSTLELKDPRVETPLIVRADEILQTSATTFDIVRAELYSSRLPSDPGVKVYVAEATIEERKVPRLGLLGQTVDRATGTPLELTQTWVRARNVWFEIEGFPVFYSPYLAGDARDPLGPVQSIRLGYDAVFEGQFGVTLDAYQLLGIQPYEGTDWSLVVDYLTLRGPGFGTNFNYQNRDLFNIPSRYNGFMTGYTIYDHGLDNLGGYRIYDRQPTDLRGRFLWQQGVYDLPYGFQVQAQAAYLSDRNFLEQYFRREFDSGVPEQTFLYVKQQQDNWAWTAFVNGRTREWITETESLPNVDGYLLGQTFLGDRLVYNTHASIGYFQLKASSDMLTNVSIPTDVNNQTGRVDWMQEWSVPLHLGALSVVPYARLDLTGYTNDLTDEASGRVIGGGGVRASMPFSRLDADVQSDLFNLNGIHHKMTFNANWYYAEASESYLNYAQIDRLNDDITDQQIKEVRQTYPLIFSPTEASFLISPLFDPQRYAIRRTLENRIDTRDDIHVVQLGWNNRWQTKRGFPGSQHIIDWMTLDFSASFFPQKDRDNFGNYWAFLEYDWTWNIGDRTALTSNGWIDPIEGGARVFNFGMFYNRPDGTNFYLGYRNIDPLESRAIIASATYTFSPKYSGTAGIMYDFGSTTSMLNQSLTFNRIGTDLTVSIGVNYNALQNNFGLVFAIVPNLVPQSSRGSGTLLGGPGGLMGGR